MSTRIVSLFISAVFVLLALLPASAVTTAISYQGKLTDSAGNPLTGSYDFSFKLFDALTEGTQIGSTVSVTEVSVTEGIFTVKLDFGAGAFVTGADRWLETTVGTTVLSPRVQLTASPFSLFSSAPWVTSGANISYLGNVGIGTTVPAVKLDVAGTARMTAFQLGTSATAGQVLTADASGVGTWKAVPATPPLLARRTVNTHTTALATDTLLGVDVTGGPVAITLPLANSVPEGKVLVISHENGDAGANPIVIIRQGADKINDSRSSIAITFGVGGGAAYRLYSDGVSKWRQW